MESRTASGDSQPNRGLVLPTFIFLVGFSLYLASVAGAVLATSIALKIALATLAGAFIANLAIIGHDAVHRSFTRIRWLNRIIGTAAFLPALHPYGRWEHHHNRIHHCYTAQIGVDNAFSPMTPQQYRSASPARRLYYRFMRSLAGQTVFYMIDIWALSMFVPYAKRDHGLRASDWRDIAFVYAWLILSTAGFALLSWSFNGAAFPGNLWNGALYGVLIPFLVWNVFISFVTIVQHTGPKVRWVMPTGRFSTQEERLNGTVHIVFPGSLDWFFHRVMQHLVHHVNPIIPLYRLKDAEEKLIADAGTMNVETWTPLYHWRMARDCKLYDPVEKRWCGFPEMVGEFHAPAALAD
jgi:acyl-lipid omega-6 desaturase (Delta-12 desaturase)